MWKAIGAAALALSVYSAAPVGAVDESAAQMTQARMEALLRKVGSDISGVPGMLEFTFHGVRIGCISDVEHDRMRLITPVRRASELSPEQVTRVLEANFHTALDARYASSQGILYAAYIHPLAPLSEGELQSAVRQVANLAQSFGSTYSSGELVFSPGQSL
jgi:hypothetical protein